MSGVIRYGMQMGCGVTLLLLCVGGLFAAGGAWLGWRNYTLERDGLEATGRVVELAEKCETDPEDGYSCTYAPVVQFRTQAGQQVTFRSRYFRNPPAYQVGETVTVLYLPEDPHHAEIRGSGRILDGLFLALGGALILIGLVGLYGAIRSPFSFKTISNDTP